ncbi:MAG: 4Fe-4S dicluster domain-containing protein [Acidobacteriota bacterium]|nr:4Fe-4S dicluster domain-containing protein [Acidobacteriota bacterium]
MSVLRPIPLSILVRRAAEELPTGSVYDLPVRHIFRGAPGLDLSVGFHGHRAATPIGPAAGPQTQLAQNIALSYLAGGRILELKTVQVNDHLVIPRPCIDMRTVGFNVEWSQELAVGDSLREYAKARLLVAILDSLAGIPESERDVVFDVSVGYDLAGIRSPKMSGFFDGIRDAGAILDEERSALRRDLPSALRHFADVPCDARLSDSVTLSTFHGCPAEEIEAIGRHLLVERGLNTIVKLNPTLLGYEEVEEILHGRLGYGHIALRRAAFEKDLQWDGALAIARDLSAEAARLGLGFGFKVTNTLVVANAGDFMPGDEAYLSGEPLHVLALAVGLRLREELGAELPVSFSAGVDAANVAGVVACGFVPVTSCTDLLRPGGYQRLHRQAEALAAAMGDTATASLPAFIRARAGLPGGGVAEASLVNHRRVAAAALGDARYAAGRTGRPPRKIGSHLHLFDCINCDKCIPVCPNDANFVYETAPRTIAYRDLVVEGGCLVPAGEKTLALGGAKSSPHQIANWADACNDCGNCDVFCPEDGGPYIEKPRLFSSMASFVADAPRPGFFLRREEDGSIAARGRWGGREVDVVVAPGGSALFCDGVAELRFASREAAAPEEARLLAPPVPEGHVVPVGHYHALRALAAGLFAPGAVSWLTASFPDASLMEISK